MKLKILMLLFISQIGISQNVELNKLIEEGNNAFSANNFVLAKATYTKATNIDLSNKDVWYNLAASELNLGEKDNACEHFYKAYLLNDGEALKNIKEYCPNFRNGTIMSMVDVEEKPKFTYEGTNYLLIENNSLNSLYLKILTKEFKKSKILKEKVKGKIYVQIGINENNAFSGKVYKVGAEDKNVEIVKMEIMSILKNMVTYISAKNKGVNVDLWDKWALPINY
jgi:tetratricopeptide (TPR) repeat protein